MAKRLKGRKPQQALARRAAVPKQMIVRLADGQIDLAETFLNMALDPRLKPENLERLIALQERIMDRNAKLAFIAAFQAMRPALPTIDRKGRIVHAPKEGRPQKAPRYYAKHEDIQDVVRPILAQFGFTQDFRTEWPPNGKIRIVGVLTHEQGHSRESAFEADPDTTGDKNAVQARGSAVSYGRRYTTIDLLNIVTRGQDDDGTKAGTKADPRPGTEHSAGSNPEADEPITQKQRQRLATIVEHAGRDPQTVSAWLAVAYNYGNSKEIKRRDYEAICAAVEKPGPLPMARREPGEEG